jgi:hypothetical protein
MTENARAASASGSAPSGLPTVAGSSCGRSAATTSSATGGGDGAGQGPEAPAAVIYAAKSTKDRGGSIPGQLANATTPRHGA